MWTKRRWRGFWKRAPGNARGRPRRPEDCSWSAWITATKLSREDATLKSCYARFPCILSVFPYWPVGFAASCARGVPVVPFARSPDDAVAAGIGVDRRATVRGGPARGVAGRAFPRIKAGAGRDRRGRKCTGLLPGTWFAGGAAVRPALGPYRHS